jgi:hypothetical protein
MDVFLRMARPEQDYSRDFTSPRLYSSELTKTSLAEMNRLWLSIQKERQQVFREKFRLRSPIGPPPFSTNDIPIEVQRMWTNYDKPSHDMPKLAPRLPEDLEKYLNHAGAPQSAYVELERMYLANRGWPNSFVIRRDLKALGAVGDVARDLEVLVMRSCLFGPSHIVSTPPANSDPTDTE